MTSHEATVLLTGFPGFRARKMVEHLLSCEEELGLTLLIQAEQWQACESMLARIPGAKGAIELLEGNPTAIDLGLSGKDYQQLAQRVVRIHHIPTGMYPDLSDKDARRANVGGMREALEFARQCSQLQVLVAHSSAKVSGDHTGTYFEAELNVGQKFSSAVEETLAIAERMARGAMGELPIIVLRPTQIVGDSTTGEVDRLDGPYLLILLILSASPDIPVLLPARGNNLMNLVPVDFVVRAADQLSRDPRAVGKTFHLNDPKPLTVRQLFELVAKSGGTRLPSGFIPDQVSRALVNTPGLQRLARSPRAFVNTITTPVRYDMRNVDELLDKELVLCPTFETYVDQLVAYVRQRLRERDVES